MAKQDLAKRITRLERHKKFTIFSDILLGLILILFIIYIIYMGHKSFLPKPEEKITIEVVGIVNNTNATTIVLIHFECIKFCGKDLAYSSNEKVRECWKECEKLGK